MISKIYLNINYFNIKLVLFFIYFIKKSFYLFNWRGLNIFVLINEIRARKQFLSY